MNELPEGLHALDGHLQQPAPRGYEAAPPASKALCVATATAPYGPALDPGDLYGPQTSTPREQTPTAPTPAAPPTAASRAKQQRVSEKSTLDSFAQLSVEEPG